MDKIQYIDSFRGLWGKFDQNFVKNFEFFEFDDFYNAFNISFYYEDEYEIFKLI